MEKLDELRKKLKEKQEELNKIKEECNEIISSLIFEANDVIDNMKKIKTRNILRDFKSVIPDYYYRNSEYYNADYTKRNTGSFRYELFISLKEKLFRCDRDDDLFDEKWKIDFTNFPYSHLKYAQKFIDAHDAYTQKKNDAYKKKKNKEQTHKHMLYPIVRIQEIIKNYPDADKIFTHFVNVVKEKLKDKKEFTQMFFKKLNNKNKKNALKTLNSFLHAYGEHVDQINNIITIHFEKKS